MPLTSSATPVPTTLSNNTNPQTDNVALAVGLTVGAVVFIGMCGSSWKGFILCLIHSSVSGSCVCDFSGVVQDGRFVKNCVPVCESTLDPPQGEQVAVSEETEMPACPAPRL